jgi:SAM-dependent methyltransferase
LKKINSRIPPKVHSANPYRRALKGSVLGPFSWLFAAANKTPGMSFHLRIARIFFISLFKKRSHHKLTVPQIYRIILNPMESVRYFEFDFFWKCVKRYPNLGSYLDVSSPRLFTCFLLNHFSALNVHVVNPDLRDLTYSNKMYVHLGVNTRCHFYPLRLDEIPFQPSFFDTIVSISVIEHLPGSEDVKAISKLWDLLRPNGSLLISVPCAKGAFEEYIDFNEYGILAPTEGEFVFGQRFYDEKHLHERIFSTTGLPKNFAIFGETRNGICLRNRAQRFSNHDYPFWAEPTFIRKNFRYFNSVSEMPGWGVIAMEFIKR